MRPIVMIRSVLLGVLLASASGASAEPADFSGTWTTTYGPLHLKQADGRVVGYYDLNDSPGLVEGTVEGRRLTFTYREPEAAGEGRFDLAADGQSFEGRWRAEGDTDWSRWTGERSADGTPGGSFDGVWNTSYGPLRLRQDNGTVTGFYRMSDGRFAAVSGKASGTDLDFSYDESGVKGTAHIEMEPDGSAFAGTWEAEDGNKGEWTGARIEAKPGRLWLVVLEAGWQESLDEREYAFGTMLGTYFARAQNVECRHRFFDDAESLKRACSEIPFLPEPVVVAIASHGSEEGIVAGGQTIDAEALADCFARADNVILLHFSACLAMAGSLPADIAERLPPGISFPMSGYSTSVDWGASAAAEFLYLDLVLARGMEPADAAGMLVKLLPVAGDRGPAGSPFAPLGFRLIPAKK